MNEYLMGEASSLVRHLLLGVGKVAWGTSRYHVFTWDGGGWGGGDGGSARGYAS